MNDLLGILVTWRISVMLVYERGPGAVFECLRALLGIRTETVAQDSPGGVILAEVQTADTELGRLFLCIWCLSFWVGVCVAQGSIWKALAYSAGAIVINHYVDSNEKPSHPD